MAKQYTYEVEGTQSGFIPGYGEIVDGKIETDEPLTGVNYKLVGGGQEQQSPVEGVASQQNPNQPETAGEEVSDNQLVQLG